MKPNTVSYLVALAITGVFGARADDDSAERSNAGAVYSMDNSSTGNNVLVFRRSSDGTISFSASQSTGGLGTGSGLGSQGSVQLSSDGQWLFACNAGSNEISVFAASHNGLQLTDKVGSGGQMPISMTLSGHLLYVLNAGGAAGGQDTITGFYFDHGKLAPIPGSTHGLSGDNTGPAQASFASDGDILVVTEKTTSLIDTFTLDGHGLPDNHKIFASPAMTPFGFASGHQNRIYVSNAAQSSLSSYQISDDGDVEVISDAVPTMQNAACWVALTDNNRFAYTANAASGSISGYSVDRHGNLHRLDSDGRTGVTGDGSHPTDMAFSDNSRFLYSLNTGNGTISTFAVGSDGALQPIGTVSGLTTSAGGLAAH
jgi:6-phosphogluconolactonase (cycloisomerase 2 family)